MTIKKSQSVKVTTLAIIALVIPFILLMLTENTLSHDFKNSNELEFIENGEIFIVKNTEFFESDFSNQRNIFLLGSSHVGHINVTQVNDLILYDDVIVYNLAIGSDTPAKRIKSLDKIISVTPEIVFYGISYRDFNFPNQNIPVNILPTPQQLFSTPLDNVSYLDNIFPSNPQCLTQNILNNMFNLSAEKQLEKQPEKFAEPNTPFYEYYKEETLATDDDLMKQRTYTMTWADTNIKNQNIHALNEIIIELHKHKIKVVIFTTPLHEYYLKSLSASQKNQFSLLKNDLSEQHKVKIYEFEENYEGLNIWNDLSHVSYHRNVTEYNNHVAEMILIEINP